jgi:hypothetical protein
MNGRMLPIELEEGYLSVEYSFIGNEAKRFNSKKNFKP